ncbi:MAG: protein-arginine deiminase domain-containing protein [Planctomycetes bacterium]|nr:protein-arginine deiminase domain-containing protein [Planctomycetota bacterium]
MQDFYFPPDDTISVDYLVEVQPPPADRAEVSFYRHQLGGALLSGQSLGQPRGTVSLPLSGIAVTDSPIWAEFVFEKEDGVPAPRVTVPMAFSLAEPVVERIEVPADAKPGDVVELAIVGWGADAYDQPGAPTRFSGVAADAIPAGQRAEARWFVGREHVGEGERARYTVQDADLGESLEFEAFTAAPSGATARLAVPRVEVVLQRGGGAPPAALVLDQELDLTARVTPAVPGDVAWTFSDPAIAQVSASGADVRIKAQSDTAAEVTITATLTSRATGNQYTAEHKLKVVDLRLHLDADRDGAVDASTAALDVWEWGAGRKGAVVRVNADDDDRSRSPDCDDAVVNGAGDVSDLSPLDLRRGLGDFPAGWAAVLTVDHPDRIRIFDARTASGTPVLGPAAAGPHRLTDLSPQRREWGMEAVSYPTRGFDGLITLTLRLEDAGGATVFTQQAKVRVAPFVLMHHLMATEEVYVMDVGASNSTFRAELAAHVTAAGVPAPREASGASYANDRWMQDVMEFGFSTLPAAGAPASRHLPVVLRTANDRATLWGRGATSADSFPLEELLGPGVGLYVALPPALGSSLDSFGNLECSPPVTVGGKEWKFGRVIYGHDAGRPMQPEITDLLLAQGVQGAFAVDTSWLEVGHIDEVFSFCPAPGTPKKFKLLVASPQEAMTIVDRLHAAGDGAAELLPSGVSEAGLPKTVAGIKADATFELWQREVQTKIDGVVATLRTNLGLDPADVVRLPVLFKKVSASYYIAYTANSVNMLVVTKPGGDANLCVPKPFGPRTAAGCQFEADIDGKLRALGCAPRFIDDWATYHALAGEIHCGTNQRRRPPTDRWWWEQAP